MACIPDEEIERLKKKSTDRIPTSPPAPVEMGASARTRVAPATWLYLKAGNTSPFR